MRHLVLLLLLCMVTVVFTCMLSSVSLSVFLSFREITATNNFFPFRKYVEFFYFTSGISVSSCMILGFLVILYG